ncbi:hypothetical protein JKG47_11295 [Acidithiobacillus sp. MC6.1]|nr:hypothetical protein [Acidithiobacillus sp. MC6.1]
MVGILTKLSTTDTYPGRTVGRVLGIASVQNNTIYSDCISNRQLEDTLDKLTAQVRAKSGDGAIGIRFIPVQNPNHQDAMSLIAYGTAVLFEG